MRTPKLVAEIGANHQGSLKIAFEMISTLATFCHVDVIKFQKRHPRELLSKEQYNAPHPNPMNSFGSTYGSHREFLEFSVDEHRLLKERCVALGTEYSSSVWDLTSAREIVSVQPNLIKIGSGSNLHFEMLSYLCENFPGQVHLSLGMTARREEESIVEFFRQCGRVKDLVLYACTSGYPVPFEDLALLEIRRLRESYGDDIADIGFSGHHLGIAADIAAITLGAGWVERHFTLDRTWKGTDHAASLEADGMRRLARDIRNVAAALDYKKSEILQIEQEQRVKLKWHNLPGAGKK